MKTHGGRGGGVRDGKQATVSCERSTNRSCPHRLIARLVRRLDASFLPYTERLDLEAELIEVLRPSAHRAVSPFVIIVHEDACGDHDTSIPN